MYNKKNEVQNAGSESWENCTHGSKSRPVFIRKAVSMRSSVVYQLILHL
jgi:hypothetical protein